MPNSQPEIVRTSTGSLLRIIQRQYVVAMSGVEAARENRADVVRVAVDTGWTHAEVARELEVSPGRVSQIIAQNGH